MIRAALFLGLLGALWLGLSSAAWACGPDTAPAIAAAYGLTCEVFDPNMGDSSTYDLTNSGVAGFTWYINRYWLYAATWGEIAGPNPTSSSDFTINSSTNTLEMNTTVTNNQYPGMMFSTCTPANNTTGYIGRTFSGSAYMRVTYTPQVGETGSGMDAAVWREPLEALVPFWNVPDSTTRWVEIDDFETEYGRTEYDISQTGPAPGTQNWLYQYQIPLNESGTNGTLIVAPQLNGGTGLVERANNDVAFDTLQYSPTMVPVANGTPLSYPAGTYTPISTNHYCVMITDGTPQVFNVEKIQIWQAPPGNGLSGVDQ